MPKNKKDYRGKKNKGKVEQVTLPVSDTVPAPGNFSAGVLNLHGEGLSVLDSTDLIDTTGAGTAKDVPSALQAPIPSQRSGRLSGIIMEQDQDEQDQDG